MQSWAVSVDAGLSVTAATELCYVTWRVEVRKLSQQPMLAQHAH
jgi:hypothetical protein